MTLFLWRRLCLITVSHAYTLIALYFALQNLVRKKANLERKRYADGHENGDFDTTMASMLKLSFDSKGYMVLQNPTFYVLDLVCLTSLTIR